MDDCFAMINSRSKPLASYLFTNDEELKKEFVRNVSSGGMLINDTILHVSLSPFSSQIKLIHANNIVD